jgi:hypothetical protein
MQVVEARFAKFEISPESSRILPAFLASDPSQENSFAALALGDSNFDAAQFEGTAESWNGIRCQGQEPWPRHPLDWHQGLHSPDVCHDLFNLLQHPGPMRSSLGLLAKTIETP